MAKVLYIFNAAALFIFAVSCEQNPNMQRCLSDCNLTYTAESNTCYQQYHGVDMNQYNTCVLNATNKSNDCSDNCKY